MWDDHAHNERDSANHALAIAEYLGSAGGSRVSGKRRNGSAHNGSPHNWSANHDYVAFYHEHRGAIDRLLQRAVGSSEAEDCAQDTFLAAYRAWSSLPPAVNLQAWVRTIAKRKAVDHHRKMRRLRTVEPEVRAEAEVVAEAVEVAGPPEQPDPALWSAVAALPKRQRDGVYLRFVDDLPYREIGARLGCSTGAARQAVYEALTRLRITFPTRPN
jgi:RNA polymerase sigma factor (sigma-70 family)